MGGPSGIREENLKVWLREAIREKDLDTIQWEKLVSVINMAFQKGCIPTALDCMRVVLIPEGGEDYRGIGLV